jgi:Arc/MetJ-type ribon-helix-helix transcriptional regulator
VKKVKKQDSRISTRLTSTQRQSIEEKIANGEFEDLSGFLRFAIEKALAA